jgi:hypothetical protein
MSHFCILPNGDKAWRKYSTYDPINFPEGFSCIRCADKNLQTCDTDPVLGLGCSSCRGKELGVRKDGCKVAITNTIEDPAGGEPFVQRSEQALTPRPKPRQGVKLWYRRSCDTCVTARKVCSWLDDQTNWKSACDACRDDNLICVDWGFLIEGPANPIDSSSLSWEAKREKKPTWADLYRCTPWRKCCTVCLLADSHCRVLARQPDHACKKCTQLGLECIEYVDEDEDEDEDEAGYVARRFPLLSLSDVGFGAFMPYNACNTCIQMGRGCDQQRPCDSCVKHGARCDRPANTRVNMKNCFRGRLDPPPGPLYYLALGYGPGGVEDVKHGSRVEEWIGPVAPMYGRIHLKPPQVLSEEVRAIRRRLRPRSDPPPNGGQGGLLVGVPTAELTVPRLRELMQQAWPDVYPPVGHRDYGEIIEKWDEQQEADQRAILEPPARRTRSFTRSMTERADVVYVDLTDEAGAEAQQQQEQVYGVDDFGLGPIQEFNVS